MGFKRKNIERERAHKWEKVEFNLGRSECYDSQKNCMRTMMTNKNQLKEVKSNESKSDFYF